MNKKSIKKVYRVNLNRVLPQIRPLILAQIARDEGISVKDIIVEG